MPSVVHVKKARKANKQHGIEVGQEYWKWSGKANGRFFTRYFKHAPRASETTNSDYYSQAYALQEQCEDAIVALGGDESAETYPDPGTFASDVEAIANDLRTLGEEQTEKRDNMPEGLQESGSGSLLEERADACESLAQELESAQSDIEALENEDGWRDQAVDILESVSWDL